METAKQSSIYKSKQLQMLKGGTNYTMIRRPIFGKVYGHGVNEIWLMCNVKLQTSFRVQMITE